jgi:hypothetical protein
LGETPTGEAVAKASRKVRAANDFIVTVDGGRCWSEKLVRVVVEINHNTLHKRDLIYTRRPRIVPGLPLSPPVDGDPGG